MRCDSAAVRRDLPIPGSPETSTTRPSPAFPCCQRRSKSSSSSSRPTSGVIAERAVRAGLAVIGAVDRLATQEPLSVRIGIASGLVVVGDLIGAGAAQERGVIGETPNLAARLQALAAPGTLVIAESTRRQIGALFELDDLGPRPLAGFAEPQRTWRVLGESGVVSRFEALRSEVAIGRFRWNVVGDQGDRVWIIWAYKSVDIGVVGNRIFRNLRGFTMG
jgi:class 3 adenylate cyclase